MNGDGRAIGGPVSPVTQCTSVCELAFPFSHTDAGVDRNQTINEVTYAALGACIIDVANPHKTIRPRSLTPSGMRPPTDLLRVPCTILSAGFPLELKRAPSVSATHSPVRPVRTARHYHEVK